MPRRSGFLLPACPLVVVGFLTSLANGHPALAQTQEVPCKLPDGLTTPLAAPPVRAQQVDRGTSTLQDFALAVRDHHKDLTDDIQTFEGEAYFGCLIRRSPYSSDSTVLVSLAADRVLVHSKSMVLSGRKLRPEIYGAILKALGARSFNDLLARRETNPNGKSFNVPDIPGASGYATVYRSPGLQIPVVLLAGFDLDSSHLDQERKGDDDFVPDVTARDVVDRETLKAFVTAAGNYLVGRGEKFGLNGIWVVKPSLRDPDGPWRHGSVYLYLFELETNLIVFHGAFPDLYEFRPLQPIARDAVTGKEVLPQIIAAAKSNEEEGGFVDYHFDDPTDPFDNSDTPKVGYARLFSARILEPDGSRSERTFLVGSGFYNEAQPSQVSQSTAVKAVLPQIMRSVTASTVDAVSSRIERAASATAPATAFSLGGASTLSDALQANGQALVDGGIDLDRLLANSSFTLPLNMADNSGSGGEGSPLGQFTFWGSGDYRSISGGSPQSVDYDGSVTSANLGIDTKLSADLLAGVALSWSRGTVDYKASGASGDLTTRLLSVNPYVGWQMPSGMNLWSTAGYGFGKVEIDDKAAAAQESDLNQRMFAAGLKGTLVSSDRLIPGGATNLNVKGEVAFTWADVEGGGSIDDMALQVGRQRFVLEGAHVRKLDSGATFTSSLELGVRNDTGDGETGTGAEMGGALRYQDAASRLTVEGRVRTLLSHSGDTAETGVSALVRIAPNASGHGLALAVKPSWGRTASGVQQLWESGIRAGTAGGSNQARLNAEVGYGFDAPRGLGVVTPYTGLGLGGNGSQSWRMGARWQVAGDKSVSLEGARREAANHDGPEHGLMLRGALRW